MRRNINLKRRFVRVLVAASSIALRRGLLAPLAVRIASLQGSRLEAARRLRRVPVVRQKVGNLRFGARPPLEVGIPPALDGPRPARRRHPYAHRVVLVLVVVLAKARPHPIGGPAFVGPIVACSPSVDRTDADRVHQGTVLRLNLVAPCLDDGLLRGGAVQRQFRQTLIVFTYQLPMGNSTLNSERRTRWQLSNSRVFCFDFWSVTPFPLVPTVESLTKKR